MNHSIYYHPENWVSEVFESNYPIAVWEDRLKGLSKGGSLQTRVYAVVESMLMLIEAYITVLTGSLSNPAFRWMAIERFSPPSRIKELCEMLQSSDALKLILSSPRFVGPSTVDDPIRDLSDSQLLSILLGNHTIILGSGVLNLSYPPSLLIDTVREIVRFREANRSLLNAMKHGFRLPMFSDSSLEQLITQGGVNEAGKVVLSGDVRKAAYQAPYSPSFWFIATAFEKTPSKQNESFAELRLYGVEPARGLMYCRLVLEMLKLLFDSHRGSSRFREVASRISSVNFDDAIQVLLTMQIPLALPGDDPYIVSCFAPQM